MNRERKGVSWGEWLGLVALAGLAAYFVAVSWRKWPDPLIDFSRELYVPWRLSQGALLYRDVTDIFGPLSQYLNAAVFALFGPGLIVLVAANLVVFAGILAAIYVLFRRAWGPGAALAAGAVFVAVFGFSQFISIGNYNYATPYCHEATHGLLVCLLLVAALSRWLEAPTPARSFLAGGLFGLTAVLKPEIMLAGIVVTLAAVGLQHGSRRAWSWRGAAAWAAGAVLPTAAFAAWFSTLVPAGTALRMAGAVWLNAGTTRRQINELVQVRFLGFDQVAAHLAQHLSATVVALILIAGVAGLAWLADRAPHRWQRVLLGLGLAAAALWLACGVIHWIFIGRCLLGLTLVYIGFAANRFRRGTGFQPVDSREHGLEAHATSATSRLLIAVLAAVLMSRMVLAGRIYHYGFYQAALAGILVPAVLLGELPERLGLRARGRSLFVGGILLLIIPGVIQLAQRSHHQFRLKTAAVGSGRDRFYTLSPRLNPTGEMVQRTCQWLAQRPPGGTLVVLPEGEIINYLTRIPSSVTPYAFFGATTSDGREPLVVDELRRHPPDWIVIISRDLDDYGIQSYGERSGAGLDILRWVADHYRQAESFGGNPFDSRQCGALILQRK